MYQKDSPQTIQSMFNQIAKGYDRRNAILSFTLHKRWNRTLVEELLPRSPSNQVLLDLCAGTGDIAFEYLRQAASPCNAYLIDFSSKMLEHAKNKEILVPVGGNHRISYIEADVQQLPFSDHYADCASMAYGIRNVKDPALCINDVFRVLKPGGSFGILELTRPASTFLRLGHQFYLRTIMPLFGKWLTDNKEAYQYLAQSIQTFIEPREIENVLKEAGFIETKCRSLSGGIATIIVGYKKT